jgi:hypothetical protein
MTYIHINVIFSGFGLHFKNKHVNCIMFLMLTLGNYEIPICNQGFLFQIPQVGVFERILSIN